LTGIDQGVHRLAQHGRRPVTSAAANFAAADQQIARQGRPYGDVGACFSHHILKIPGAAHFSELIAARAPVNKQIVRP